MEIPEPSEDDKQFFRSLIPEDPEVEIKPMLGNLGAFVHGNMFAGLFGPPWASGSARPTPGTWPPSTGGAPSARPSARWAATSACPEPGVMTPDLAARWVEKALGACRLAAAQGCQAQEAPDPLSVGGRVRLRASPPRRAVGEARHPSPGRWWNGRWSTPGRSLQQGCRLPNPGLLTPGGRGSS